MGENKKTRQNKTSNKKQNKTQDRNILKVCYKTVRKIGFSLVSIDFEVDLIRSGRDLMFKSKLKNNNILLMII